MSNKEKIIDSWQQVSVSQYQHLVELQESEGDDFAKAAVEYLYDVDDAEQLPLPQYVAYVAGLRRFSNEPITTARLSRNARYTVNGRTYIVDISPAAFTTGQYIDFTNYVKAGARLEDTLSVVLIPEGHTYGDGYDIEQVRGDIGELPCTVGFAVVRFFMIWLKRYTATSLRFLTRWTTGKEMRIPKEKAEELRSKVEELKTLMASFPMC